MLKAAIRAVRNVVSDDFRIILFKAVGLTLLLFTAMLVLLWIGVNILLTLPWPWLETILATIAGLGLLLSMIFLMPPVTAIFAGLFLDSIAGIVEHNDYPSQRGGRPPAFWPSLLTGLQFGALVLLVNILTLPVVFLGIGAIIMLIVNAYLLSREYFTLVAARHMPMRDALRFRKLNAAKVWTAGLIPAGLALVPVLNVLVPFFSTAYFVHIFKALQSQP